MESNVRVYAAVNKQLEVGEHRKGGVRAAGPHSWRRKCIDIADKLLRWASTYIMYADYTQQN